MCKFLLQFITLAGCGCLHGAVFHVSPSGDDDAPGTRNAPWRTVQKACETVGPGDTVLVAAGLYREIVWVEVEGNAQDGPVTIQAEGKAVISGKGLREDFLFYIENKSHIRIIGFELCDIETKDGSAIRIQGFGDHLELLDNRIHNIRGENAMGISAYGTSPNAPISHLRIAGNEIFDCDAAPSEALTLNGNVDGFVVENNHVHDVDGIGIDFIGGEDGISTTPGMVTRQGVCRGNRVERARSSYEGGFGAGIYVDGGRDIVIEHNRVSECDLGIEVGSENKGFDAVRVVVRGNVVERNDKAGIVFGGYDAKVGRVRDCLFLNNLVYENTNQKAAEAEIWIQLGEDNMVQNNIIVGNGKGSLLRGLKASADNDLDHNLWFHPGKGRSDVFVWQGREFANFASYQSNTGQEKHSSFTEPGLSPPPDRSPVSGSPAIDAGDSSLGTVLGETDLTGHPRVSGGKIDLGPYERRP